MGKLTPPDIRATIRSILGRLDALERRLFDLTRKKSVLDVPFSLDGPIYASISPPYYVFGEGRAFEVLVALEEMGDTSTTVVLLKNAEVVATIVLPAGTPWVLEDDLAVTYLGTQDKMNVAIIVAGDNAAGLSVQVRLKI